MQFQADAPPSDGDGPADQEIHEAFMALCRISRCFFPAPGVRRPLFGPALDEVLQRALDRSTVAARMLEYLRREDIVLSVEGGIYFNPVRLKACGASLADLHLRRLRQDTMLFVRRFVATVSKGS